MHPHLIRHSALVLVLMGFSLAAAAFDAASLRGFRTAAWGSGVEALGASELVFSNDGVSCYRRERENLLYGESPLKEVRYCFHQNRLFLVAVDTDVDLQTLLRLEVQSSGEPTWRVPGKATWGDRSTMARVEISAPANGGASLLMYSNEFEPRATLSAKAY